MQDILRPSDPTSCCWTSWRIGTYWNPWGGALGFAGFTYRDDIKRCRRSGKGQNANGKFMPSWNVYAIGYELIWIRTFMIIYETWCNFLQTANPLDNFCEHIQLGKDIDWRLLRVLVGTEVGKLFVQEVYGLCWTGAESAISTWLRQDVDRRQGSSSFCRKHRWPLHVLVCRLGQGEEQCQVLGRSRHWRNCLMQLGWQLYRTYLNNLLELRY